MLLSPKFTSKHKGEYIVSSPPLTSYYYVESKYSSRSRPYYESQSATYPKFCTHVEETTKRVTRETNLDQPVDRENIGHLMVYWKYQYSPFHYVGDGTTTQATKILELNGVSSNWWNFDGKSLFQSGVHLLWTPTRATDEVYSKVGYQL